MSQRIVIIWFRQLKTDWFANRNPLLRSLPFVLSVSDHGRMIVQAANPLAEKEGIFSGMAVADARAIVPSLEVMDDPPGLPTRLLQKLAAFCIRFTDSVSIGMCDELILDASGCAHLWGGEKNYLEDIQQRFKNNGYDVQLGMADTIGMAWAVAHFGDASRIIGPVAQQEAILRMPPAALRLSPLLTERLLKLGLQQVKNIVQIPRSALQRRFGDELTERIDQALGFEPEYLCPIFPVEACRERLPCLEPIITATGIEIALKRLLDRICLRLQRENLGIRKLIFSGMRTDGKISVIEIGTHRGSNQTAHLYKLFEPRICQMEPALGFELFLLEATKTEKIFPQQEILWQTKTGIAEKDFAALLDRISNRFGSSCMSRFVPDEHHHPEKSFKKSASLTEAEIVNWKISRPRPLQLLAKPVSVEVAAPVPDYPPMHFRYNGKIHKIKKADGPERIESAWWIQETSHRDYYILEDEDGRRYWLFRVGHYQANKKPRWYLHGFFA